MLMSEIRADPGGVAESVSHHGVHIQRNSPPAGKMCMSTEDIWDSVDHHHYQKMFFLSGMTPKSITHGLEFQNLKLVLHDL